ncbi:hypothetical protein L1987_64989 [Smallanthus sonchifolius]|uniref:Uncharacterized protein n=1 Tax=Smallanthus sonchifolius TaxID=185202 RepID=A0ACB9BT54_9ASTR|nr:hypothetical protein L1987_64989 [Smallanthus sonchifolius]
MEQQKKTNQEIFTELERIKDSKKPVEVTTPLQPRALNFDYPGFSGGHQGDFLPMQTGVATLGSTPATRVTTTQDIGFTPGSSLRDISIVVQPIPEMTAASHMTSRFTPPICDAEIPKRFQTPNMKQYDGTTDPEEHVVQYRERMEINPIPLDLKEACTKALGDRKSRRIPPRLCQSKLYSNPDNHRVNDVEDDEEEKQYPKLPEYCFSLDTPDLLYVMQDIGDKARWPHCIALRKEISNLLSKGYLKEFPGKGKKQVRDHDKIPQRAKSPPPDAKVIGFISGGSDISGTSYFAAKRNSKEAKREKGDRPLRTSSLTKEKIISFNEEDMDNVRDPHHDGLVITLYVANHFIRRILIDGGSSVNIIQHDVLKRMGIPDSEIISKSAVLVGFSGEVENTVRDIKLPIYIEGVNTIQNFCIIDSLSCYNVILGRPWIHDMKAVPSTYHHCVKMPTPWGVVKINSDQQDAKDSKEQDVKELSLNPEDPDLKVLIGTNIPEHIEKNLTRLLKSIISAFSWKHEDMTGISKDIITHKVGLDNSFRHIHQKRRKFAPERNIVIQEEVERMLKAGMIREVKFPRWLANVVVVQKKNGKWRVYVDFTDLNKACPKDPFPLPHIDSMVDSTTGDEMLTFMDTSSGFQPIQMEPSDQCYLPKASKYDVQRQTWGHHFGVGAGKFLGYMVTKRGIEAIHEQIKAVTNLKSPANTKDVQWLTGRVAALNRFISRFSERCKEFYDILKKNKRFEWEEKHEQALQALKEYLSTAPLLIKPEDGEPLSLYLAVSGHSVSVVLVKDHEGQQHPVYYPEMSERMAKWPVKLSAYDLKYEPRTTIKSQALADFVADFSSDIQQEADLEVQQLEESKDKWIMFTYSASNIKGTCLGIILKSPQGDILPQSISYEFQASNNEAEYEALIAGLQLACDMKIRYLQVPREDNVEADALANLASALKIPEGTTIPIIHILSPAIEKKNEDGDFPKDEKNHRAFRMRISPFIMLDGVLYRKYIVGPYLKCLEDPEALEVLKDIHEGDCGNHTGGKALFSMILRTGYYWPTMRKDVMEYSQ